MQISWSSDKLNLLADYKKWLAAKIITTPPKTALGKAISYNLNQWHKLNKYNESCALSIDNNRAERAIKPFVIGRKN
jgi:transposase